MRHVKLFKIHLTINGWCWSANIAYNDTVVFGSTIEVEFNNLLNRCSYLPLSLKGWLNVRKVQVEVFVILLS